MFNRLMALETCPDAEGIRESSLLLKKHASMSGEFLYSSATTPRTRHLGVSLLIDKHVPLSIKDLGINQRVVQASRV